MLKQKEKVLVRFFANIKTMWEKCPAFLVHGPGPQNFEFLTTLRDKGYHTFLETLLLLLYFYV